MKENTVLSEALKEEVSSSKSPRHVFLASCRNLGLICTGRKPQQVISLSNALLDVEFVLLLDYFRDGLSIKEKDVYTIPWHLWASW